MKLRARTDGDKQAKKRKLLDSALGLFAEHGYQGTSIEMVTENAGVSTGTFYLYFKSKTEIYRVLYIEGLGILHDIIKESISWPGMTALAKMTTIANTYYRFYREYRAYYDIISIMHIGQRDFFQDLGLREALEQKALELLKMIDGVIREGVESGEFADLDTWQATNFFWGMMDGLMLLDERGNTSDMGLTLDELIKQGLKIVFFGVVKEKDGSG